MNAKEQDVQRRLLDEHRQLWIDTLSHARHDWLNDLQMILGYVQLRKYDKLADCVVMLKQRMAEESRAARLGAPGIVEALLTYRTRTRPYVFALQIEETIDFRIGTREAEAAEFALRQLMTGFEAAAQKNRHGPENELACSFFNENGDAAFRFTYKGSYTANTLKSTVNEVREKLKESATDCALTAVYESEAAFVKVTVPLNC